MNTQKTIIIIFIFSTISSKKSLCEKKSDEKLNSIYMIKGVRYIKTINYFYLKEVKNPSIFNFEIFCKDELGINYLILKEKNEFEKPIYLEKKCDENFGNELKSNMSTTEKQFNTLKKYLIKKNYESRDYFDQSIKNIKTGRKNDNYIVLKLKNLKEFLENLDTLKTIENKKKYKIECIKRNFYQPVNIDNIDFQPFSFTVYLNFHETQLYDPKTIMVKLRNYIFYDKFMNNILISIFKLDNKKIYIKKTHDFIFSETEILFFNFSKKYHGYSNIKNNRIFYMFIMFLIPKIETKNEIYNFETLLTKSYNYFFKTYKNVYLDHLIKWNEFKESFYQVIIKPTPKSKNYFHKFILQFYNESFELKEEKEKISFELDKKFAINKKQRKISDDIDEKFIIEKMFGYSSGYFFFSIFHINLFINIYILI